MDTRSVCMVARVAVELHGAEIRARYRGWRDGDGTWQIRVTHIRNNQRPSKLLTEEDIKRGR